MAPGAGFPWGNVVIYGLVAVAPVVVFWLALRTPRLVSKLTRRRRPRPEGLPIERLAADLRRVHRTLAEITPGTPMARRTAARQAYDALLTQACRAVEVRHRLDVTPEGVDRELERLRVEQGLRDAGLRIP